MLTQMLTLTLKTNAKYAIRVALLMVGLVGAFIAASVEPVPAADGGPILICPPHGSSCELKLPSAIN